MSTDLASALAKSLGRTYVPPPGAWSHPRCPNYAVGEHLIFMEATCDLCAPAGCCNPCKMGDHEGHAGGIDRPCENHAHGPMGTCPCPNGQDPDRILELVGPDMRNVLREIRGELAERLNESARGTGSIFDPSVLERPFDRNSTQGTPPGLTTQG